VLGVIERQRQDQERMLRTLANGNKHFSLNVSTLYPTSWKLIVCFTYIELSDDIRGERLRFVEAMKEATAINVQSNKKTPIITPSSP
jgi:hypothetical protein